MAEQLKVIKSHTIACLKANVTIYCSLMFISEACPSCLHTMGAKSSNLPNHQICQIIKFCQNIDIRTKNLPINYHKIAFFL